MAISKKTRDWWREWANDAFDEGRSGKWIYAQIDKKGIDPTEISPALAKFAPKKSTVGRAWTFIQRLSEQAAYGTMAAYDVAAGIDRGPLPQPKNIAERGAQIAGELGGWASMPGLGRAWEAVAARSAPLVHRVAGPAAKRLSPRVGQAALHSAEQAAPGAGFSVFTEAMQQADEGKFSPAGLGEAAAGGVVIAPAFTMGLHGLGRLLQKLALKPSPSAIKAAPTKPGRIEKPSPAPEPTLFPMAPGAEGAYISQKYAANLNLERVNSTRQVKDLLVRMSREMEKEVAVSRRGKVSHAQTRANAEELLKTWTPDEIKRIKRGTALNDSQLLALREIEASLAAGAAAANKTYLASPTTENLLAFRSKVLEAQSVFLTARGAVAEAGRALQQQRMLARAQSISDRSVKERAMERVLSVLGGKEFTAEMAEKFATLPEEDPTAAIKFIQSLRHVKTGDKVFYVWISSILSHPKTHQLNAISNAIFQAAQLPKRAMRALVDIPLSRLQKRPREYYSEEALPAAVATYKALPTALRKGLYAFLNGVTPEEAAKLEIKPFGELRGGIKNPLNWPLRLLSGADIVNKTMNYEGEITSLAMRQALKEGKRGSAAIQRVGEILANPSAKMMERAQEFAEYTTYTGKPTEGQRALSQVRNKFSPSELPPFLQLRYYVPFLQVPYKITSAGFEWSPVGLARLRFKDVRSSPEAADVIAKSLMGSLILAGLQPLAARGQITGAAPRSKTERDEFYRLGKQPYSIKIGDKWIAYRFLGPLALPFICTAGFHDAFRERGEIPLSESVAGAAGAIGKGIIDASYLQGLSTVLHALEEPSRFGGRLVSQLATGFVWPSGALRGVAQATDPYIRDPENLYERIKTGLPFLSKTVPPRLDVFGRDIIRKGGTGGMAFVLTRPSPETKDRVDRELARLKIRPGFAGKSLTIGQERVTLSRPQQFRYQKILGNLRYQQLKILLEEEGYRTLSDEKRVLVIENLLEMTGNTAREYTRAEVFRELSRSRARTTEFVKPIH